MADLKTAIAREIGSYKTPPPKTVAPLPAVGAPAPESPELGLPRPKPTLIVFLRNCGDPFAEKTFRRLAALSTQQPGLACVAVSHSDGEITDRWIAEVGGAWDVEVVADAERDLYARWGLGLNTAWQLLNPRAVYATVTLGRTEGIWGRSVESGNRWQMGGAFAVDAAGVVRWVHVGHASDDVVDFAPPLGLLGLPPPKRGAKA